MKSTGSPRDKAAASNTTVTSSTKHSVMATADLQMAPKDTVRKKGILLEIGTIKIRN